MEKHPLGRGLASLFNDDKSTSDPTFPQSATRASSLNAPIENLYPNPDQPRRHFDKEALGELTESIARNGVLQPILVRPHPFKDNAFEIVAGERRWQASQKAGLTSVPIIIKELDDSAVIEIALIENIHRRDLNPLEEAAGYRQLLNQCAYSQEKLAEVISRSRSHIANTLRLLNLSNRIKDLLNEGSLSSGHARALLGLNNAERVAAHVVKNALSVRQTERLVQVLRQDPDQNLEEISPIPAATSVQRTAESARSKDCHMNALQQQLSDRLGLKITIKPKKNHQSGTISLQYRSLEDFERIREALESLTTRPSE